MMQVTIGVTSTGLTENQKNWIKREIRKHRIKILGNYFGAGCCPTTASFVKRNIEKRFQGQWLVMVSRTDDYFNISSFPAWASLCYVWNGFTWIVIKLRKQKMKSYINQLFIICQFCFSNFRPDNQNKLSIDCFKLMQSFKSL